MTPSFSLQCMDRSILPPSRIRIYSLSIQANTCQNTCNVWIGISNARLQHIVTNISDYDFSSCSCVHGFDTLQRPLLKQREVLHLQHAEITLTKVLATEYW